MRLILRPEWPAAHVTRRAPTAAGRHALAACRGGGVAGQSRQGLRPAPALLELGRSGPGRAHAALPPGIRWRLAAISR